MTLKTGMRAGGALTLLLLAPSFAPAAWNNVFQVTCCGGGRRVAAYAAPVTSFASPCCPAPCPQTAWVQRSFCQPVTSYQAVNFMEPVTTMRTSHFWEPVTSFSMSCFVDPCTGCTQQVAVPQTSFRLRTQCNAVQSWVQRVGYRPVTTMRQSFYWEQVAVQPACPAPCPAPDPCPPSAPVAAAPPLNLPQAPASTQQPPAALGETREQYFMPPANPSRLRTPPVAAPIKTDRIASRSAPVTGQIVTAAYSPRSGAEVVFVNASRQDIRQTATADATGRYQASLPAGEWLVYVDSTYHNRIDVKASEPRQITIVSR